MMTRRSVRSNYDLKVARDSGFLACFFSPLDVGMATANWFQRGEGLISHYCGGANIHGSSFVNEPAIRKLARK